jgi:uncharacterized RmlC-like cupin family protein
VGAGPHYHRERDEFFYVLDGELVLRIGDEMHIARAGAFAFVPRETVHGFHNASSDSATVLVVHHPAGFEQFLEEMEMLAARHGSKQERAALAARVDMIFAPGLGADHRQTPQDRPLQRSGRQSTSGESMIAANDRLPKQFNRKWRVPSIYS